MFSVLEIVFNFTYEIKFIPWFIQDQRYGTFIFKELFNIMSDIKLSFSACVCVCVCMHAQIHTHICMINEWNWYKVCYNMYKYKIIKEYKTYCYQTCF